MSVHLGSGNGFVLPELDDLRWEYNQKGGYEAWHAPNKTRKRRECTYLSYVNLQMLDEWSRLTEPEQIQTITDWVNQKRVEKGIKMPTD